MLIADSDLPPPISPPPPLTPSPIETLDESIGVHDAVQSLALSSPNQVEEEEEAVSVETLTVPSLVPVECYDEPFSDICCLSDNYKRWTPNVSPGFDTDDESTSYWSTNQPLYSFIQDPPEMIDEPTGVVCFLKFPFPFCFFVFFVYNMGLFFDF